MSRTYVNPPALFDSIPYGFSQAVVASGTRTVDVSGQTAVADALRELVRENARPASTWIGVAALARPESLIEIEAVGVLV